MTSSPTYRPSKATALLAHILDIASPQSITRDELDALTDAVCEDDCARAELIQILSTTQNKELPMVLYDLLGTRQDRLRNTLEHAQDVDMIYGKWLQRIAGGGILACLGFWVAGAFGAVWGLLILTLSLGLGALTSYFRAKLAGDIRMRKRLVDQTDRLMETVKQVTSKLS